MSEHADVELIARAIADADAYVNDGWRLCIPAAEAVRAALQKAGRLAEWTAEWDGSGHFTIGPRVEPDVGQVT